MRTPPLLPLPPPSSQGLSRQPCPERIRKQRRQRRSNYDAYKCLLLVMALAVALVMRPDPLDHDERQRRLSRASTKDDTTMDDFSDQSCELIGKHSTEECLFATTCNGGDGIFLGHLIYCSSEDSTNTAVMWTRLSNLPPNTILWIVSGPLALLLIVLFRILGSTAEEFFSPGLAMLSQKLGLPERFAGVTLLALGNGAPDVASTVNAIRNDPKRGYLLALGELTGASMVASTLIVGAVAFVSPTPVHCRGAFVRDVVMFILTMMVVYLAFNDGTIDPREIRRFIGFYIAYVVLVLGADVYHRKFHTTTRHASQDNVPTTVSQEEHDKLRHDYPSSEATSLVANKNNSSNITSSESSQVNPKKSLVDRLVDLMTNYDTDKEEEETVGETHNGTTKNGVAKQPVETHPRRPVSSNSTGWGERDEAGDEPLMVFHPHHGGIVNLKHTSSRELLLAGGDGHWLAIGSELRLYLKDYVDSIYGADSEYNRLEKFLMVFELPFTFLRMVSLWVWVLYHVWPAKLSF